MHLLDRYKYPTRILINRNKFNFNIFSRDERLFYKVLESNVEEVMPLVYTPIVGEACIKYGFIFTEPKFVIF
jgi:malate dehydrogenase (oxaloacetate-decarboxylating)(NADP+)